MNEFHIPFVLWLDGDALPDTAGITVPIAFSVQIDFNDRALEECREMGDEDFDTATSGGLNE